MSLIVSLDVDSLKEARRFVRLLKNDVSSFKIGSVLFTSAGPEAVKMVHDEGGKIFLDLKFHDIPNTVAGACKAAADLGVFMVNVHASGGLEMLEAARKAIGTGRSRPLLIGVTVLTSQARTAKTSPEVVRLAKLCRKSGLDGVVCSPQEIEKVRKACGKKFVIVTPGIRLSDQNKGDQKRIATPQEAIRRGADYLVIGRPILEARDPVQVVRSIR